MCGITGAVSLNKDKNNCLNYIEQATEKLNKRGPDSKGIFNKDKIAFGHRRLSIIDVSNNALQPMTDPSQRYTICFNGEIYNFGVYRRLLEEEGVQFKSTSDTEVLLHLYIKHGENCLEKLNGFFAFAIWDNVDQTLFLARDRMGIKPLYYWFNESQLCFASEMKSLLEYQIPKKIDQASLFEYLQLNYIPAPNTIFEDVFKLPPAHYLKLSLKAENISEQIEPIPYYQVPTSSFNTRDLNPSNYSSAKRNLATLLDNSVQKRMVSDVPLGSFLSGGIDSSVIASLASRHTDKLNTFSIGFSDNPFFDETEYAELVAKKIGSAHHTFRLNNQDFFEAMGGFMNYLDEPFADSSALNVYLLSQETRKHVTVALSGDGADEMFSGYNKHYAEFRVRNPSIKDKLAVKASGLLKNLPQGRESKIANLNRQIQKFSKGVSLTNKERYWYWATFRSEEHANYLLKESYQEKEQRLTDLAYSYKKRKEQILKNISKTGNFNEVLYTDTHLVLPNDMLFKVDSMSMANSLEVRTPFLDHEVVNFAFQIPVEFKINANTRKKILKDAFQNLLPEELLNRPKQGFEIPLLDWLKNEMKDKIENEYLSEAFIEEQGIFNYPAIQRELNRLSSNNPGDVAGTIWNLVVFQHWYKKYML